MNQSVAPALTRRALIAGTIGAGAVLSLAQWTRAVATGAPFVHGLASGNPLPERVVIWTRVTPSVEAAPGSGADPPAPVT